MTEWISVKERLPEEAESVLLYSKGFDPISGFLNYSTSGNPINYNVNDWNESDGTVALEDVTHWMPLPEAPND